MIHQKSDSNEWRNIEAKTIGFKSSSSCFALSHSTSALAATKCRNFLSTSNFTCFGAAGSENLDAGLLKKMLSDNFMKIAGYL